MISYREYITEIENYVEQNMLDQVIAHSSHILKKYPSAVEALRFLGQAYLEEKKFTESAELFERTLSILPDDFVSHVGMSAIKEEARDLDSAIFHMEVAFDTQPSNVIVQEELKRLIQIRDGEKPQKINLSRGALIRMHIKGQLFQQSLNEINVTLSENPDRIDLQILQALVYSQSNSKVQAAETCNRILEHFPYCLEPNRILFEIYMENGLKEQAGQAHDRLTAVNPYYEFVNSPGADVEDVPDSKVELDKLDYTSAFSAGFQEIWSLPPREKDNPPVGNEKQSENGNSEPKGNSVAFIPDFMSEAGWEKSDHPEVESHDAVDYSSDAYSEEPVRNTELPEWLKNFQPSTDFIENSPLSFPTNDEAVGIIEDTNEPQVIVSNVELTPAESLASISEVNMSADNSQPPSQNDESSDWMSQFFEEANKSTPESDGDKPLPDWLKPFDQQEESISDKSTEDEVPDWLKNLDSQITNSSADVEKSDQQEMPVDPFAQSEPVEEKPSEVPEVTQENDLVSEIPGSAESAELTETASAVEPVENDFFQTLEELTSSSQIPESTEAVATPEFSDSESPASESTDTVLPDWVKSVLSSPEEEPQTTVAPQAPSGPESLSVEEILPVEPVSEIISEAYPVVSFDATSESMPAMSYEATPEIMPETSFVPSVEATSPVISEPVSEVTPAESFQVTSESASEVSEGAISKEAGEELLQWLDGVSTADSDNSNAAEFEPQTTAETTLPSEPSYVPTSDISLEGVGQEEVDLEAILEPQIETTVPVDVISEPSSPQVAHEETFPESSSFTDSEPQAESVSIQTEVPEVLQPVMELSSIEKFQQLLADKNFHEAASMFTALNSAGLDNEKIIELITSGDDEKFKDFDFMQFLGDTLAEFNQFEQAMEIYSKAESLLTGK